MYYYTDILVEFLLGLYLEVMTSDIQAILDWGWQVGACVSYITSTSRIFLVSVVVIQISNKAYSLLLCYGEICGGVFLVEEREKSFV